MSLLTKKFPEYCKGALEDARKAYLRELIEHCGTDMQRMVAIAGVNERHLRRLFRQAGIQRPLPQRPVNRPPTHV